MLGFRTKGRAKSRADFRSFHSKTDSYAKNISFYRGEMGRKPKVSSYKLKRASDNFKEFDKAAKEFRLKHGKDALGYTSRKSTGGTRWSAVGEDIKEIDRELKLREKQ